MDLRGSIPCLIRITGGKVHDVNILDELVLEPGSFYIMLHNWTVVTSTSSVLIHSLKTFFGTTENAVKTQIWIAISVYVLVAIIKKELEIELSLGKILQILSIVLFEKVPITQVLTKHLSQNESFQFHNQLLLFDL
ncbi:hypothetical protein ES703_41153 [subsurface metagenome]